MFLKNKLRKNNSGFTLIETIIAGGLMGAVVLVGASIIKSSTKNSQKTKINMKLITEINEVKSNLKKISAVSWMNFNSSESYFDKNNLGLTKTEWTLADQDITDLKDIIFKVEGNEFFRNSHSLELSTTVTSASGVSFSRCLERVSKDNSLTPAEAYNLPNVPLVKYVSGQPVVHCCPKGSKLSSCDNPVSDTQSKYVLRTFFNKKSSFRTFPLLTDSDFVDGMGFILIFNNKTMPSSYEVFLIQQSKTCYLNEFKKSCIGPLLTKLTKFGGKVRENGVNDNGVIQIR